MSHRPDDLEALRAAWTQLQPGAEAVFADLVQHYSEPHRAYHNLTHLRDVLTTIDGLAILLSEPRAVYFAAWFHDVIYDPQAKDNEGRSADYAARVLPPTEDIQHIRDLILLTKTHAADPADTDAAVLLDADLAILGAPPAQYDAYAQAIRQEYARAPDDAYRSGRAAVLRRFLERPRLFQTAPMFTTRETTARANLQREIAALTLGMPDGSG